VVGTLRGTREVGVEALEAVSISGRAAVKAASEVTGDVASAARNAVEGAIIGARDVGLSAEQAAAAAATGALEGAGEVGGAAIDQVRNAVTGVIGGVRVVLREPFRAEAEPERKAS
jgi:hypothetical protein